MAARQVFTRAIQRMGLTASTPVAVAVSGGSDSLALTLLARQTFQKVIGIIVDHRGEVGHDFDRCIRFREESTLEAERTGELVKSLGVERYILSLDWGEEKQGGGLPRRGKLQVAAREKKYLALLSFCRKMNIRALMVAHHLDDQNETFIMRMAKGSGIDGLGGMYPSTVWAKYPQVNILRPLLEVRKADLQEVCRNEGVEWIEDSSNLSYDFVRNNIRKMLQENEELVPEITRLVKTCQETRRHVKHLGIVASTVKFHSDDLIAVFCSLTANKGLKHINLRVDKKYGYLSFSVNRFLSLPHFVAKKVFHSLASHIGGARGPIPTKTYLQIHKQLLSRNTQTFGTCILFFPDLKKDTMIIGRALPGIWKQKSSWTPISVGQTILWDGRWRITLKSLKTLESKKAPDRAVNNKEQLYVRHMKERDHEVARRGIRKIRAAKLPPVHARAGLPVICTESGYVVLAPHFLVIDHTYGVDCDVAFEPLLPLLQDSETHVC